MSEVCYMFMYGHFMNDSQIQAERGIFYYHDNEITIKQCKQYLI